MNTSELFLLAMLPVSAVPFLLWRLGRIDDVAPLVAVPILAGIALGPGAVMDAHWFDQRGLDTLRRNLRSAVMPVYFLSTGLRTNWATGGSTVPSIPMAPPDQPGSLV
jgi:hypothetical protein